MADLDDFFAKKDRKKSKGGKKFTTTEELAKKLEETHKREKEKLKEKKLLSSQNLDGNGELGGERQEEDEWKEFEEEKKDYTNLKIQNLQIVDPPPVEDIEENEVGDDGQQIMEENEAGEMVPRKKQPSGPWKAMQQQQQQQQLQLQQQQQLQLQQQQQQQQQQLEQAVQDGDEVGPDPASSDSGLNLGGGGSIVRGSYVPPHQRNVPQYSHTSQPLPGSRLRSKVAPDVNNEALFPTLSAATSTEPVSAWGKRRQDEGRGFEEVRNSKSHTTRYDPKVAPSSQGPNLSLGNKWDALRDQS